MNEFQVRDKVTGELQTIYSVHKSGPRDTQTKFLLFKDETWVWQWAVDFVPERQMTTERLRVLRRRDVA